MASPNTENARRQSWVDDIRVYGNNRMNPRETRPRDRSLRGKTRRQARRAANRQENTTDA